MTLAFSDKAGRVHYPASGENADEMTSSNGPQPASTPWKTSSVHCSDRRERRRPDARSWLVGSLGRKRRKRAQSAHKDAVA